MPPGGSPPAPGDWRRALGLFVVAAALSVVNPAVLVGVPLVFLALLHWPRKVLGWVLGGVVAAFLWGRGPSSGFWFLERGWGVLLGGWFTALTFRWPGTPFFARGLGAVAGALGTAAAFFAVRPGVWAVVEWSVTERMEAGIRWALRAMEAAMGPEVGSSVLETSTQEAMALHRVVFPALLGLASLASLGVVWWLRGCFAVGEGEALRPLKEFRFSDQLVWVFIAGLAGVLAVSGKGAVLGTNAAVFMGSLYALRGLAVLLFMTGGLSVFGGLLLLAGMVFLAPLLIGGLFVLGLSDAWLDFRARRRET